METIRVRSRSNGDGMLHLDVPVGIKDTELEVTLTIFPARQGKGYPPGFFEQTYGSCVDDPIVIDDEGIIEEDDDEFL
ncbi:MAG: hypothetical protein ACRC80_38980 [Waterburya sp.]